MTGRDIRHCTRGQRHGAVLVAALVCLLVVMMLLGSMLQSALRSRRQMHRERDLRQTELILQAGVQRAAHRLTAESDYRGETWSLPAELIIGRHAGQVTIEVQDPPGEESRRVQVIAEYPAGSDASIRRSRALNLANQPLPSQE